MSGETKDFTKIEKVLGPLNPHLPKPINVGGPCKVRNCVAITCKYNVGKKCSLDEINIGPKAQCLDFAERKV